MKRYSQYGSVMMVSSSRSMVPDEFNARFGIIADYLGHETAALDVTTFQTERDLLTTLQDVEAASFHAVADSQ